MPRRGVVGYDIDDDPHPASVDLVDEAGEPGQVTHTGVDPPIVAHVVPVVEIGRGEERGEPYDIDPKPLEVVEGGADPFQIPEPVTVAVGEGPDVDLVTDGPRPPGRGRGRRTHGNLQARG